jgi:Zn-finger nucleic acid-binding protein/RNA polymerase subunit RPABC4/transcription elongation factor Spt4
MARDAGSLHCPNCGAAVSGDGGRCPYCQAKLATVSCPSCFALMFEGARYCQKCGAERTRSEAEDAAPIACPGCRGEMRRIVVGTSAMLECAGCDGVWLDADAFEKICADRESQTAVLHRYTSMPGGPHSSRAVRVQYRPCPRCHKMMNRVNFGRLSGAVVDVCKGHGTFLDPGELHQVVTFIVQGGLERARARQIEDLRDEQRKLADAERKAVRDRAAHGSVDGPMGAGAGSGGFADLLDLLGGK